ncbi:MAG: hypothetical protein ACI9SC_000405 [Gammaproteobacteria bacterium]|jgi:hypothetical protein
MSSTDDNDGNNVLTEKLEELESLLGNEAINNEVTKIKIPVLDELVTEADFINTENENDLEQVEEQIIDLAEKLEHKFSGELDQLVRLLKDNLKNSIVEELRNQANLDMEDSSLEDTLETDTNIGRQKADQEDF